MNLSLAKNTLGLGLDVATKTGWGVIVTDNKGQIVKINYGTISVAKQTTLQNRIYYLTLSVSNLVVSLKKRYKNKRIKITVEDCFLKCNPTTLKVLACLEGAVISTLLNLGVPTEDITFIYPSTSRKNVGIKGTLKKKAVLPFVNDLLNLDLEKKYHDVADGLVLALNGVLNKEKSDL